MTINKVYHSPASAVMDIPDGASVAIAGFGLTHSFPSSLTVALREQGAKSLCIVANSLGEGPYRSNALIENRQVNRLIVSFSARAGQKMSAAEKQIADGSIGLELVPQGTLVERLRAGGSGIPAFYTRTGVGTAIAEGKEVRSFDGVDYLLEQGLTVDYAFIRAHRADRFGNLEFLGVGHNFMPSFAKGAAIAIAEVDEIVDGALPPERVHLPGIFVHRVVVADVVVPMETPGASGTDRGSAPATYNGKPGWTRAEVAEAAAGLLTEPSYVNLGLGMPTLISNYVSGRDIVLESENGLLGYGSAATPDDFDPDVYNAGGQYVQLNPGASYFDSVTSFEIIRGKVDTVVLGAFQVDAAGNLANWTKPGMIGGGIGGAMDLVSGKATVMVLMTHTDSSGRSKLVDVCDFPLTGTACVDVVVTDLGIFQRRPEGFALTKAAPGFSFAEIAGLTAMTILDRTTEEAGRQD